MSFLNREPQKLSEEATEKFRKKARQAEEVFINTEPMKVELPENYTPNQNGEEWYDGFPTSQLLFKPKNEDIKMFNEDFQLYFSWYMNMHEFISWTDIENERLGSKEFLEKYPTFESMYSAYNEMIQSL